MVILIKKTLSDFALAHPSSSKALNIWYELAKKSNWGKLRGKDILPKVRMQLFITKQSEIR